MISFDDFLTLNENRASSKTGLYPFGYDGIGNYPPAYLLPASADAVYYLSIDDRFAKWWEGPPFNIKHIEGDPVEPKGHKMPGIEKKHDPHGMPGKTKKPNIKLPSGNVRKPEESPLPGKPTRDCLVKNVKTLDPKLAGTSAEKSICASKIPD